MTNGNVNNERLKGGKKVKATFRKFIAPFLFILTLGVITSLYSYDAKADVGVQSSQGINVRSTKIESNRIIKVPEKESERQQLSRGSSSASYQLIQYAYKFLGRPYVWAASGPKAFDCSGFTSYVYSQFGYDLPHYTGEQVSMGKSIAKSNLKTGDLVFFDTTGSDSHVGIYIGNGKFIHASSGKRKVMVSDLSEAYYKSRFSAARRIIS